jgi:hypothetical protein
VLLLLLMGCLHRLPGGLTVWHNSTFGFVSSPRTRLLGM